MIHSFVHYALFLVIGLSVFKDFVFFKIDNGYCLLIALLYGLHFSLTYPFESPFGSLGVAGLALGVGFFLVALGLIGAGDVKFMAALLLWIPPHEAIDFIFVMTLWGSLLSFAEYYFQNTFIKIRNKIVLFVKDKNLFLEEKYKLNKKTIRNFFKVPVPYGVAIGMAAWMYINF